MSKAYANFQLAELIPEIGDPLVSPDGTVEVRANNNGTATITAPGAGGSLEPPVLAFENYSCQPSVGNAFGPVTKTVSMKGPFQLTGTSYGSTITLYVPEDAEDPPATYDDASENTPYHNHEFCVFFPAPTYGMVMNYGHEFCQLGNFDTTTPTHTAFNSESESGTLTITRAYALQTKVLATTDQLTSLPSTTSSDVSKILSVTDSSGTLGWVPITTERYTLSTPTQTTSGTAVSLTLNDKSINQVSLASTVTGATVSFPAKVPGYARDFFVRLVVTGETVPAITWQEANGDPIDFDVDDDSWAEIEQGVNILMFTETSQASAS